MKNIANTANFKKFSKLDYIYIDKTEQIYNLIKHNRVFISRPRRFGKSLMLDLIATLFEKGVDPYFKDLWIYDKWSEEQYPVLRLNFLDYTTDNYQKFCKLFYKTLVAFTKKYNLGDIITPNNEPDEMLFELIQALDNENKEIVLLIDEYDAPLAANINNRELYNQFQSTIRNMYGIIKNKECIYFLCITGVTRLKDVEILSVGSDIADLSYHHPTSTIMGFTREEIKKYYIDYINLTISLSNQSSIEEVTEEQRETFLDLLAEQYDGYCFDPFYMKKVYSTWSVNNFFKEVQGNPRVVFDDYWYRSGGFPTILANYLKEHIIKLVDYTNDLEVGRDEFWELTSLLDMRQEILMCQTGYLTIHSQLIEGGSVLLGFPNKEVQHALEKLVASQIFKKASLSMEVNKKIFSSYSPDQIVEELNRVMNSISYEEYQNINERTVKGLLHAFMIGAGQNVLTEKHSALGRSDIVIEYDNRRLVFELKYANTEQDAKKKLEEAIEQIKNKRYGNEFPNKELLRLALVFNGEQNVRRFTHYEVVQ